MKLSFLGHAGFLIETEHAVVVTDPWLSPEGAFDSSWFQLPQNHHLAATVREKLSDPSKERFVYVSHEHKDHFDSIFLASLPTHEITAVIPFFQRSALRDQVGSLAWKRLLVCRDGGVISFPGGGLKVFVSDSSLNRDSSLLVRSGTQSFLDLNDCKIHDRMEAIAAEEGPITAFAAQFSGAIWHPVRYDYDPKTHDSISRKKMFGKFESVARAIRTLQPKVFLASAGPACFLDPTLIDENFRKISIFPRAPQFFSFLEKRLGNVATRLIEPMPGDCIDVSSGEFLTKVEDRLTDENFESYVRAYSRRLSELFSKRQRNLSSFESETILDRLEEELQTKLDRLALRERISMPLFVQVSEVPNETLRVRFKENRIDRVATIPPDGRHALEVAAGDIVKVLDRIITWDEFLLSLRFRMSRKPDVYDPIIHGFFAMEQEDLPGFCDSILANESRQERTLVQAGSKLYSIHRYCPHQGADLTQAWVEEGRYLICPRHRWSFDLENQGKCTFNDASVHAIQETPVSDQVDPGSSGAEKRAEMAAPAMETQAEP